MQCNKSTNNHLPSDTNDSELIFDLNAMAKTSRYFILINIAVGAIGIGIGVLIGYFSNTTDEKPWVATVEKQLEDIDETTIPTFISKISSDNIRSNLQ